MSTTCREWRDGSTPDAKARCWLQRPYRNRTPCRRRDEAVAGDIGRRVGAWNSYRQRGPSRCTSSMNRSPVDNQQRHLPRLSITFPPPPSLHHFHPQHTWDV
eukprot:358075-Chlamydomonas_euryale.AAC.6